MSPNSQLSNKQGKNICCFGNLTHPWLTIDTTFLFQFSQINRFQHYKTWSLTWYYPSSPPWSLLSSRSRPPLSQTVPSISVKTPMARVMVLLSPSLFKNAAVMSAAKALAYHCQQVSRPTLCKFLTRRTGLPAGCTKAMGMLAVEILQLKFGSRDPVRAWILGRRWHGGGCVAAVVQIRDISSTKLHVTTKLYNNKLDWIHLELVWSSTRNVKKKKKKKIWIRLWQQNRDNSLLVLVLVQDHLSTLICKNTHSWSLQMSPGNTLESATLNQNSKYLQHFIHHATSTSRIFCQSHTTRGTIMICCPVPLPDEFHIVISLWTFPISYCIPMWTHFGDDTLGQSKRGT